MTTTAKKKPVPEGMMTYDQAAELLCIGRRTLERYKAEGRILKQAMFSIGGRIFFREKELQKIMKGGGIK